MKLEAPADHIIVIPCSTSFDLTVFPQYRGSDSEEPSDATVGIITSVGGDSFRNRSDISAKAGMLEVGQMVILPDTRYDVVTLNGDPHYVIYANDIIARLVD